MNTPAGRVADQNKALLEQLLAQTALGNIQPLLDALAEDVTWTVTASTGRSKTQTGKEPLRRDLIAPLGEALRSTLRMQALRVIAARDVVCVVGRVEKFTGRGESRENSYCWIFEFRAGRIVALKEFLDTEMN